jgi:hypothetical protein
MIQVQEPCTDIQRGIAAESPVPSSWATLTVLARGPGDQTVLSDEEVPRGRWRLGHRTVFSANTVQVPGASESSLTRSS